MYVCLCAFVRFFKAACFVYVVSLIAVSSCVEQHLILLLCCCFAFIFVAIADASFHSCCQYTLSVGFYSACMSECAFS